MNEKNREKNTTKLCTKRETHIEDGDEEDEAEKSSMFPRRPSEENIHMHYYYDCYLEYSWRRMGDASSLPICARMSRLSVQSVQCERRV